MLSQVVAHAPFRADIPAATTGMFTRASAHPVRRAALVLSDLLMLLAVVLCLPFVILAVGIPIALLLQVVLWIGRLL